MNASKGYSGAGALLLLAALVSTGCATKKYVQQQVTPVQQRIEEFDKKQTQALAQLEAKQDKDVSRVEERAMTADNKAVDAARAAQLADQKAAQAADAAQNATKLAQADQAKLGDLSETIRNIDNYKLVHSEDFLFGFNRYTLKPEEKAKLDQIVQKVSGLKRYAIEVEGFTDKTGSAEYNLALSRRRADTVVRHLVAQGIPVRRISMVGLGPQQPAPAAQNTRAARQQQRRVVVRVYGL
jgi:outer membrane protein OmpA-like peptidoglycan-associated protein